MTTTSPTEETAKRTIRVLQSQLRDARTSLDGAHTTAGMEHLKQVLGKYIEMDESQNAAIFKVLMTLLGYTEQERRRMEAARERRTSASRASWF